MHDEEGALLMAHFIKLDRRGEESRRRIIIAIVVVVVEWVVEIRRGRGERRENSLWYIY
jgi:hypothetical protein